MKRGERPTGPVQPSDLLESVICDRASVVCELTAGGRGAICVLGVSANQVVRKLQPFFLAANGKPLDHHPVSKPVYGRWNNEDIIVCVHDDRYAEIHCHGGDFARQRIINDLTNIGFQAKRWSDLSACSTTRSSKYTRSSNEPANPSLATTAAEASLELPKTTTRKTAAVLTWQSEGVLDRELTAIDALIDSGKRESAIGRIRKLIDLSSVGLHMTRPWQIAIAGTPNVGKSSLINRIVGYNRSIVFDMPGTTRDLVTVETAIHGWPAKLIDTAGLRASDDQIEQAGVALAEKAIHESDVVIEVLDGTSKTIASDFVQRDDSPCRDGSGKTQIVVINKCDVARIPDSVTGLRLSALTGEGLDDLLQAISRAMVPDEPPVRSAVPFLQSQVDALNERLRVLST